MRRGVDEPDHALGVDARRGEVVAGADAGERVALVLAGDREHHEARARASAGNVNVRRGCGWRASPLVTTRRSVDGERGRAGEQRRGVAVGAEPEVHEVDRRRGRDQRVVRRRGGRRRCRPRRASSGSRAGRTWSSSTARAMPSLESGSSTGTQRSSPNHTSMPDQSSVAAPRALVARRARCRRRRARSTPAPRRRRASANALRHVVDHPDLSVHGGHDTDDGARHGGGVRGSGPRSGATRRRPRFLDQVRCARARRRRRARSVADLGCGAGLHLPYLPRPAVALDAAVRDGRSSPARPRPTRGRCRPTSRRCRSGAARSAAAWARASYLHVAARPAAVRAGRPPPRARGRRAGAPHVLRGRDERTARPTTTSPAGSSRRGPPDALRRRARRRGLRRVDLRDGDDDEHAGSTCRVTPRPHAARHRRARHAPARVRSQPVGVLGRRGRRVRPPGQPLLARGARRRDRHRATATPPRAAHHGVGMTDLVKRATPRRRRAHARRVPRRPRARRAPGALAPARRGVLRRARRAGAPRSTARRSPACSPTASAASRLRDAEHQRPQRTRPTRRARRPPPRRRRPRRRAPLTSRPTTDQNVIRTLLAGRVPVETVTQRDRLHGRPGFHRRVERGALRAGGPCSRKSKNSVPIAASMPLSGSAANGASARRHAAQNQSLDANSTQPRHEPGLVAAEA